MSNASSRRAKRPGVKSGSTLVRRRLEGGRWYEVRADGSERPLARKAADWSRLDAMTEKEREAAAKSDPDAQPLADKQLKRMRRVPYAKHVRWAIGLNQEEFAAAFGIPIGTLRDWEQGRCTPDQAALSYLKVIERDPKAVREALEGCVPGRSA
jgi:putative transcriptional regulator